MEKSSGPIGLEEYTRAHYHQEREDPDIKNVAVREMEKYRGANSNPKCLRKHQQRPHY